MTNKGILKSIQSHFTNKHSKDRQIDAKLENHNINHNFTSCPNCMNKLK